MTATDFIKEFELLADAPNGVQKLREMILQLAVQGKLVPQEEIHHEAHEEHEGGKGKRTSVDGPYPVPPGWRWTTLSSVVDYNYGAKTDSARIPSDAWLLDLEDVEKDTSRLLQRTMAGDRQSKSTKTRFRSGDVLYGKLRPYLNKVLVADRDGFCTTEIVPMHPFKGVDAGYVLCVLKSRRFLDYTTACSYGVKMPRLGTDDAKKAPFPLPPLAEQKRIVAKVEELMRLCDELETRKTKRDESRIALNASCLSALTSPTEGESVPNRTTRQKERDTHKRAWQRIRDNFDILYDTPATVAELRKTILQLAVQGRLVPQEKTNHEGHEEHEGEGGREKDERQDAAELQLPVGWRSVQLGALGKILGGGTPSKMRADLWCGDLPWVSPKDMKVLHLDDSTDHVSPKALSESAVRLIPPRSLLVVVRGMILAHTFPAAVNMVDVTINQDMKALVPHDPGIIDFLLLACRGHAERVLSLVERSSHGTCKLNTDKLFTLSIGIPPLAEQKRIVAKVNELMALCDALEVKLTQSREDADTLVAAVAHQLLNGKERAA